MWVNEMLTIWLYGTIFGLAAITLSLAIWYKPEKEKSDDHQEE